MKPIKCIVHNNRPASKLRELLADYGWSGRQFQMKLKTMSQQKFWDHERTPENYSIKNIKEMAIVLDINPSKLMIDLGLMGTPVSYDLDKDEYVYA